MIQIVDFDFFWFQPKISLVNNKYLLKDVIDIYFSDFRDRN